MDIFPLKDFPKTTIVLLLFLIGLFLGIFHLTVIQWQMPLFYIIGILVVIGSLFTYFVPSKYELFEQEIRATYLFFKMEKRYSDFGCFYADAKGVMLSTFKQPRRLDKFRGFSLRFSKTKDEKDLLFQILKSKVGQQY